MSESSETVGSEINTTVSDLSETETDAKDSGYDLIDDISWAVRVLCTALLGGLLIGGLIYFGLKWANPLAGADASIGKYVDTGAAMTPERSQYVSFLSSGVGVR
jgi:hypothetical protein